MAGDRARSAMLREHALSELDPELEPFRYGRLLAKLAKAYWSLNRGRGGAGGRQARTGDAPG